MSENVYLMSLNLDVLNFPFVQRLGAKNLPYITGENWDLDFSAILNLLELS